MAILLSLLKSSWSNETTNIGCVLYFSWVVKRVTFEDVQELDLEVLQRGLMPVINFELTNHGLIVPFRRSRYKDLKQLGWHILLHPHLHPHLTKFTIASGAGGFKHRNEQNEMQLL